MKIPKLAHRPEYEGSDTTEANNSYVDKKPKYTK